MYDTLVFFSIRWKVGLLVFPLSRIVVQINANRGICCDCLFTPIQSLWGNSQDAQFWEACKMRNSAHPMIIFLALPTEPGDEYGDGGAATYKRAVLPASIGNITALDYVLSVRERGCD